MPASCLIQAQHIVKIAYEWKKYNKTQYKQI